MASPPVLHLFPSIATSMPRETSLRQAKPTVICGSRSPSDLKGVAIQVSTTRKTAPVVQPAEKRVKHSVVREKKTEVACKGEHLVEAEGSEDTLGPLPENNSFGTLKPSQRQKAGTHISRPKVPPRISTEGGASMESLPRTPQDDDQLSPLPQVTHFKSSPPRKAEFPSHASDISGSPTLVRSNSGASSQQPKSPPAIRSIFPQYDPGRPLNQQQYYPTGRSATPTLPMEKVSKIGSPVEKQSAPDYDSSCLTIVDGYEHIPRASEKDMLELWKASCSHFPVSARKLLLGIHQPRGQGTCLSVGTSLDLSLYTMVTDNEDRLVIKKHCPNQPSFTPVAQLTLPDPERQGKDKREDVVRIFPQMAAVHAQGTVSNPLTTGSDTTDTARATNNVVSSAYIKHTSRLIRTMRKRDSLGAVTATYTLKHPQHGSFPITVTKSTAGGRHTKDPRAKISLHHPSATPAAITAETLVLAFLDFARDACVFDTPALVALDGPYVIDTIVAALLAVAVIENDALMADTVSFAPPPTFALAASKRKSVFELPGTTSAKRKGLFRRKGKKEKVIEEEDELPVLAQGALAILGLSFKTAVWVLETGVKVTAGVVVGVSHLATKA